MAIMRTFLKWRTDRKIPCLAYLGQKPEAGCEGGSSAGEQGENPWVFHRGGGGEVSEWVCASGCTSGVRG